MQNWHKSNYKKKIFTGNGTIKSPLKSSSYFVALPKEEPQNQYAKQKSEIDRLTPPINRKTKEEEDFLSNTNFGAGLEGRDKEVWENKKRDFRSDIEELEGRKDLFRSETRDLVLEKQSFSDPIRNLASHWEK